MRWSGRGFFFLPVLSVVLTLQAQAPAALPAGSRAVLNAPFTATRIGRVPAKEQNGKWIEIDRKEFIARDSAGRMLTRYQPYDLKDPKHTLPYVWWSVYDPATKTRSNWCECGKVITEWHFSEPRPASDREEPPTTEELLGIPVRVTHTTRTVKSGYDGADGEREITTDAWTSPDLHLALRTVTNDPARGETRWELKDLKRGEPSEKMFFPPKGYTVRQGETENQAAAPDYN